MNKLKLWNLKCISRQAFFYFENMTALFHPLIILIRNHLIYIFIFFFKKKRKIHLRFNFPKMPANKFNLS